MSVVDACLIRSRGAFGEPVVRLGMPLADDYLEFLQGRCRPNTVLAAAYDLRVFFRVVDKPPTAVRPADVLAFITAQRTGRAGGQLVQPVKQSGEPGGLATSTVARRLSIVSGFFAYLQARGDVPANPVPRGLPTRRERSRPGQGVPLTRRTRRLPRILTPAEVDALTGALRTSRDRAMVAAMVLGGLRRCEVLGLRLQDLRVPSGEEPCRARDQPLTTALALGDEHPPRSPRTWTPNAPPAPPPTGRRYQPDHDRRCPQRGQ